MQNFTQADYDNSLKDPLQDPTIHGRETTERTEIPETDPNLSS